jgi:hypothetical protein
MLDGTAIANSPNEVRVVSVLSPVFSLKTEQYRSLRCGLRLPKGTCGNLYCRLIDGWRPHQRRDEYPLGHRFQSATLRPGVADFLLLADPFQLPFAKHSGSANISDRPLQPRNYGAIGRRVCKSLRIARLAAAAARCLSVCPLTISPKEKIFSSKNSSNLASAYSAAAITQ